MATENTHDSARSWLKAARDRVADGHTVEVHDDPNRRFLGWKVKETGEIGWLSLAKFNDTKADLPEAARFAMKSTAGRVALFRYSEV